MVRARQQPRWDHGADAHQQGDALLGDLRFRALVSDADWMSLSPAVRRRFAKRTSGGATVIYTGKVIETRLSRAGFLLAQVCRLIGGPLPTARDREVPSVVTVTEDFAGGGQVWTRLYARRSGFPQVIHSAKRFSGPTGLEEHVGWGVGMTLTVSVTDADLIFRSERYFVDWFGVRVYLPRWLTPGDLTVIHSEDDETHFTFSLCVEHPRFGQLVHQTAAFEETAV
jgi:hypothetical protein